MSAVITCAGLTKNYGRKQVLQGVNLTVPAGSIFALLGTNGAGKTTLIRTILGLIPKSGGDVRVLGEEPYRLGPQLRQKIGYVSEEQGLYAWMTIRRMIAFCKGLYRQWDDQLVAEYLERFQLDPGTKVGTLSKGQTVKLALILALAPKPELLVLDEPMTGLDPLAQHEFLQVIMRDVSLAGRSIFFSTHSLADAEIVAQQAAILYHGKIQTVGAIPEIRRRVVKVKYPRDTPPQILKQGLILSRDDSGFVLLRAADGPVNSEVSQIAAAGEISTGPPQDTAAMTAESRGTGPVTLEEAFLFFCAGGETHA